MLPPKLGVDVPDVGLEFRLPKRPLGFCPVLAPKGPAPPNDDPPAAGAPKIDGPPEVEVPVAPKRGFDEAVEDPKSPPVAGAELAGVPVPRRA